MDATAFKDRYIEFENIEDSIITTHLEECKTLLSVDKYASKYEICLFLLTAHELSLLGKSGDASEVIQSRSIEGGSVTFKNLAKDSYELYYSKSVYGKKYLAIKRTIRFVGAVCV